MDFNSTQETVGERTETENHEGGQAFEPDSPELALTKVVINNLLDDTFYESDEESFEKVESRFNDVAETNPEFALKLAKYARQEENLRQIPQALLVLAAEHRPGEEGVPITPEYAAHYVEDYATGIMSRADEPLDVIALWVDRNGTSVPAYLRSAIESAMHQWNEWQYSKWDQPNREWQYRDLMNVVHPRPQDDERKAIFEKIAHGDLDDYPEVEGLSQTDTWESSLSNDDDDRSKQEKYEQQLSDGNMGLFPRIRQCRDMLESGVSTDDIFGDVTDEWIRNSRLYPFRFYQAYKAITGGVTPQDSLYTGIYQDDEAEIPEGEKREAQEFLEHAMQVSTENLPKILEDTFVAVDTSGSMESPVSTDSNLQMVEIASLFGSLVYERGADLSVFADDIQEMHADRRNPITTNMENIYNAGVGGGTNGYLIPKALRENNRDEYSQVIVFTDMQMWNNQSPFGGSSEQFREQWNKYTENVNPDASLYLVDLQSYGDLVTPEGAHNVYNISGWTENVIDFIDKMENVDGMIQEIESTEPDQ